MPTYCECGHVLAEHVSHDDDESDDVNTVADDYDSSESFCYECDCEQFEESLDHQLEGDCQ